MKISIVVPAHNEEENIADVIKKIENILASLEHEIIVVNDHSIDKTPEIVLGLAKDYPNLRLVHNTSAGGFANAIRTGFANINSEVVVPVMADLCDDLTTIGKMLEKIKEGYDVVCGCRYSKGGRREGGSRLKGSLSEFGGLSLRFLLGIPTHDIPNAFKMYRKKVIDSVESKAEGFEISMEIPLKAYFLGFKITEVPTVWKERTKGKSSFKIFKLLPAYSKLYLWGIWKRMGG
ncbi:MAG TPA: glycosyltransferase [Candidatus Margulisiibacteriota bacterium]|nr:glycosyltransferase [Candidatus Margulisiibacteriota bacterium]